jgi:hypothetical protein
MHVAIAVIVLLFWLLVLAQNTQDIQYYIWAMLLIALWAWPRSRQDPDNRRGMMWRILVGGLIVLIVGGYALLKDQLMMLILPAEVIILLVVGWFKKPVSA